MFDSGLEKRKKRRRDSENSKSSELPDTHDEAPPLPDITHFRLLVEAGGRVVDKILFSRGMKGEKYGTRHSMNFLHNQTLCVTLERPREGGWFVRDESLTVDSFIAAVCAGAKCASSTEVDDVLQHCIELNMTLDNSRLAEAILFLRRLKDALDRPLVFLSILHPRCGSLSTLYHLILKHSLFDVAVMREVAKKLV